MEVSSPGVLRETGATGGTSCSLCHRGLQRPQREAGAEAAGTLCNLTAAVLIAWEAPQLGNGLLLSLMVIEHRLSAQDPLAPWVDAWKQTATALLLDDQAVLFGEAAVLVVQGDNDAEV